jgi:hypothetical protein
MSTIVGALLTAEDYAAAPEDGRPTELVSGRVHPLNVPAPRPGQICGKVVRLVGRFLDDNDNDSGTSS